MKARLPHVCPRRRTRVAAAVAVSILLGFTCDLSATQPDETRRGSAANVGSGFEDYHLIAGRNIFDPARRRVATAEAKPQPSERIALVGTMQSDGRFIALFESSDPPAQQALLTGQEIAGYTVAEIHFDRIELTLGELPVTLPVDQELRRLPGGEWQVSARDSVWRGPTPRPAAAGSHRPHASDNASEIVRRLQERRQSQLKQ